MLSKCANPSCSASFRYFHQGKLFRMETAEEDGNISEYGTMMVRDATKTGRRAEFFWLCDRCAREMTLVYDHKGSVLVKRIRLTPDLREAS
jgi:hypothetical protein